ncbi:unnamed protein product [Nyctereutes procyonoides]|uniref:(raccoon dog) hypothetical protein n=1 Tax=Nyctereutes procyonoides TaxID=34880 RepID=A0A811XPT3_NYCPR|nr:unnamed protein product [Nyctereutes procyonoides]
MGQRQSVEHGYFLKVLQAFLREKGFKVSHNSLDKFFDTVRIICPWFPDQGSVDLSDWQRVGQTLKNELKIRGEQLPPDIWTTWNCMKEVLDPTDSIEIISLNSKSEESPPSMEGSLENQKIHTPPLHKLSLGIDDEEEDLFDGPYLEDRREEIFVLNHAEPPPPPLLHSSAVQTEKAPRSLFPVQPDDSYPIKGATPLQRALYQASQRGEDVSEFQLFSVTVQGGQRAYTALSFKVLKDIKQACTQYGPTAPFTLSMLDNMTREALCPGDWRVIAQACLSPGDNLLWKTQFSENAEKQASYNRGTNIPVDYMLTGSGPYYDVGLQLNFPEVAYTQINSCSLSAWKKLPTTNTRSQELSKIRQGPEENYYDFVARLLTAVSRIVTDAEAGTLIVKQLAYENANAACQAAIRPWKNQGTLEDYVRLCADLGPSNLQGVTLAAAFKGIPHAKLHAQILKQNKNPNMKMNQKCFLCGQLGHFKNQCPQKKISQTTKNPQNLCPRCHRGYHWANECRSKTDSKGNPLSGNWKGGLPRPQQTIGALFPQQTSLPSPTPMTSLELTDYTAVPPPVQD